MHCTSPLRRGEHAVANENQLDFQRISTMNEQTSDTSMNDDVSNYAAVETQSCALEEHNHGQFPFIFFLSSC